MKKMIAFILMAAMMVSITAAFAEDEQVTLRLGGLKGATSIGMVKLLSDAEKGETKVKYDFTMAAAADELAPLMIQGKMDVLAVPANLASVLYNKTEGKVQFAAVNTLGVVYVVEKGGETDRFRPERQNHLCHRQGHHAGIRPALSAFHARPGHGQGRDHGMEERTHRNRGRHENAG